MMVGDDTSQGVREHQPWLLEPMPWSVSPPITEKTYDAIPPQRGGTIIEMVVQRH
jgi:hypothetical protein